jgi:hypothetical protein
MGKYQNASKKNKRQETITVRRRVGEGFAMRLVAFSWVIFLLFNADILRRQIVDAVHSIGHTNTFVFANNSSGQMITDNTVYMHTIDNRPQQREGLILW